MTPDEAKHLFTGRWDRIATFGLKIQEFTAEDGEVIRKEWNFTEQTFRQWVENFERLYAGRHLPYDFEHQAVVGAGNTQPVMSLASANGLCAIKDGRVYAFFCQDLKVSAPDPAQLLAEIQARYPSDPDPDGCWAFRCAATPLGIRCLANCEQLSPTFDDKNKDEAAEPIGSRLMTISVVGVAHQDRTVLNHPPELWLGTGGLGALSAVQQKTGLSALAAGLRKGRKPKGALSMPTDENKPTEGAMTAEEYAGKLGPYLKGDDKDEDKALAAYALATEDPPAMRAKMAAFRASKLGQEGTGDSAVPTPVATDKVDKTDKAAMGILSGRLGEEAKERAALQKQVELLTGEKRARDVATFTAFAATKVSPDQAKAFLAEHGGDPARATAALSALKLPDRAATGALGRRTLGGNPIGASPAGAHEAQGAFSATASGNITRGSGLAALAAQIEARDKIDYGAALVKAQRERPDLY